jgi:Uncharacterized conserved protein
MANNPVIGRMRIQLGIDAAEVEEGLKSLSGRLSKFAANLGKVAAGLGVTMGAITAGISAGVMSTIREIDKLAKAARAIGTPVEELGKLRYAAEQNGLAFETLASGMQTLSQKIVEAASNAKSSAAQAFDALGISVRDASGRIKSTEQVLLEIADAFSRLEDGATKATAAQRLFGSAGGELIGLLNEGSFAIKALGMEAEQLGLVLDQKTTEAAERLTKALDRSNKSLSSLEAQIVTATIPVLERLAGLLENIAFGVKRIDTLPLDALQVRLQEVEENAARLKAQIAEGLLPKGIRAAQEEELARMEKLAAALREQIALRQQQMQAAAEAWETTVNQAPPGFENQQERMQREAEIQERLNYLVQYGNKLWSERIALEQQLRTPQEELAARLERIALLQEKVGLSAEMAARAQTQAVAIAAESYAGLAATVASAMQQIFGRSKAAAVASAIANIAQSITRTLAVYGGTPWGWSQAAAAAASGAAQLATIKSTNIGSGGGAPSVRGTGADTATPPQQAAMPVQTLHVAGISPGQLFKGEAIRELVEELLEFQRDGGRVILV